MIIQPKKDNLNYLIDPIFTNVNRLFVFHFKELLEKIIQRKIVETLSHIIMYRMSE